MEKEGSGAKNRIANLVSLRYTRSFERLFLRGRRADAVERVMMITLLLAIEVELKKVRTKRELRK